MSFECPNKKTACPKPLPKLCRSQKFGAPQNPGIWPREKQATEFGFAFWVSNKTLPLFQHPPGISVKERRVEQQRTTGTVGPLQKC